MVRFTGQGTLNYALCDPDVQLMLSVRDGDMAAFTQLWLRWHQRVQLLVAHLLGSRRHSEDLAQEVFLRVFRARHTYVASSRFSTWLFTIVKNVALNARRSLATRGGQLTGPARDGARWAAGQAWPIGWSGGQPQEWLELQELRQVVRNAVDQLGDRQREAVRLCGLEQLSQAEAAAAMGTSVEAVKSLLHRARIHLRGRLAGYVEEGCIDR